MAMIRVMKHTAVIMTSATLVSTPEMMYWIVSTIVTTSTTIQNKINKTHNTYILDMITPGKRGFPPGLVQPETTGIIDPYDALPDQAAHHHKDIVIGQIRQVGDRPEIRPRIIPEG